MRTLEDKLRRICHTTISTSLPYSSTFVLEKKNLKDLNYWKTRKPTVNFNLDAMQKGKFRVRAMSNPDAPVEIQDIYRKSNTLVIEFESGSFVYVKAANVLIRMPNFDNPENEKNAEQLLMQFEQKGFLAKVMKILDTKSQ